MSHRTLSASLALLTLLGACADVTAPERLAAPAAAARIVNGAFDAANAYPAVGALMFDYYQNGLTGDDEVCTGSLISPTVFLTAAHCVADFAFTPPGSQFYVSFASDLYSKKAVYIKATGYTFDPAYGHDNANLHDLAVVFLPAGSTKGLTPYRLPTANELSIRGAQNGLKRETFTNVGYGTSASRTGQPSFGYDGRRNVSQSLFSALKPYWLELLMNTAATGLGGDCYGDSGGPKFLDSNPGVVYATVTTGDYNCRATTVDYRTDTDDARAFLGQFVTLP